MKLTLKIAPIFLALVPSTLVWGQASVNESAEKSFLYVDGTNGSDSNPGTQAKPFKTLTKGVNTAQSQAQKGIGTRVTVQPGTYRESITVGGSSTAPVTIEAATAGTVTLSGADVWTGWQAYGGNSNIFTHSWPYTWGYCPLIVGPTEQNIVRRREQIFVNGFHLTQVLSLSEMTVGTFFVNESNQTVYVWPPSGTNISSAAVEVATRPTLFYLMGLNDWVIRGINFEGGNGCRQIQPAVIIGDKATNVLIDNDKFLWNNAAGLSVGNVSYVTVQNSVANHNGESGMLAQDVANGLWSSDEGSYNNWRGGQGAYYGWQSAGGKFMSIHNGNFQAFTSLFNLGKGIHFDTDNMDITLDSLRSLENLSAGAQLEATQGPVTISSSNICNNNRQILAYYGGLNLVDAAYVTVTGSTLYNNGTAQIEVVGRTGGISVENYQTKATTQVYNQNFTSTSNTIEATVSQEVFQDSFLTQDWARFADSLISDDNTWWNSSNSSAFMVPVPKGGTTLKFTAWQAATGQDSHSTFSAPGGSATSGCQATPDAADYWITTMSGANTVSRGGRGSYSFILTPIDFSGTVSLKADVSTISGASASWSSGSINTSGSSTLTVSTSSSMPTGTYPVTVIANNGNLTRTVTVSLVVQ